MNGQPDVLQAGQRSYALERLAPGQNRAGTAGHTARWSATSRSACSPRTRRCRRGRKRLAEALGEIQLLLMEAEEYQLAANAGRMKEGLLGFNLLSNAYRPVYDALNASASRLSIKNRFSCRALPPLSLSTDR